jgi:hypothetical protein
MQCPNCSHELTKQTHSPNCNWDTAASETVKNTAGDSPEGSDDDISLPRNPHPTPPAADLPNQQANSETSVVTQETKTDVKLKIENSILDANGNIVVAGVLVQALQQSEPLQPSVGNDVEIQVRKRTVSKEANIACTIIEGPNPVAPAESLPNEQKQMHLDTDEFVADTFNFASLIWKQGSKD